MKKILFYILILVLFANCSTGARTDLPEKNTIKIIYDSTNAVNYKLILITLDTAQQGNTEFNSIFIVRREVYKGYVEMYKDSIYSTAQKVELADYNNDGMEDILVQNISDVRSNWTYYLYLVDSENHNVKKIRGFESIKNPRFVANYNLIDNYVNSGRNWTEFYSISGDSIFNYGITIYDDGADERGIAYDTEYQKAIDSILMISKTTPLVKVKGK